MGLLRHSHIKSEPQPDGLLRILPAECGGRTWNEGGFIHGAPELVAEIAKATRFVDLGPKLCDYERAGVLEYVVCAIDPDEIFWFAQERGVLCNGRSATTDFTTRLLFPASGAELGMVQIACFAGSMSGG